MQKNLLSALFLVMLFVTSDVRGQQVFKISPTSSIGFLEYLPADYHTNSNKYPVVIFLHGIGERGPNSTDPTTLEGGATLLAKHGPPKHVRNGTQFPFILISPQLKSNYGNWPTWYVMEIINYVKTYLRIDERRIHITGLSLGGGGAWTMAQTYPKLFASLSPVCGGYNAPSKACAIAGENLPVWAFHGDADPTVSLSKTVNMVNAINACTPAPNPLARISIYPGIKHNAWDRAYATNHTYHNPNVYEWIMSYTNTVNGTNKIPVANAGSDKTTTGSTYTLTGSASDADGTITAYSWEKLSGPTCTMTNTTARSLSLSKLGVGEYMFRFTAVDNAGDADSDYIRLTVHQAPVANAGPDVSVTLPTTSVVLTGSGTDADGTISSYSWTVVSGPVTPTLTNATSKTVTVSSLTATGDYVLQLQVKDNKGGIGKDQVKVTVNPSASKTTNTPPVAKAGADLSITLPTATVSISGSGTDSDGTISAYKWTFISGPVVPALANATTSKVSVSGLSKAGSYTFELTVTDNDGATASDQVIVTVNPAPTTTNQLPVANAGKDLFVYLPETSVTIIGSGTDPDGTIVSYTWNQVAGPVKATLSGANTSKLSVTGMTVPGFYVFKLTVKDNSGAIDDDKVGVGIKDITTTTTSSSAEQQIMFVARNAMEEDVDLSEDDSPYWNDKQVVIYNEVGATVYSGNWVKESYATVFGKPGMYIYNVMQGSQRMKSGKLVITP